MQILNGCHLNNFEGLCSNLYEMGLISVYIWNRIIIVLLYSHSKWTLAACFMNCFCWAKQSALSTWELYCFLKSMTICDFHLFWVIKVAQYIVYPRHPCFFTTIFMLYQQNQHPRNIIKLIMKYIYIFIRNCPLLWPKRNNPKHQGYI